VGEIQRMPLRILRQRSEEKDDPLESRLASSVPLFIDMCRKGGFRLP